jgi:ABC-type sugar transport system ATPase subunit
VNLKVLLRQFGITTVYVTHDHVEALILADRLAIMGRGRIEQIGTYQEIYDEPRNEFVAGFLNRHAGTPPISFVEGEALPDPALRSSRVGVRPEDVHITREPRADGVAGTVVGTLHMPMLNATIVSARVREREVYAQMPGSQPVRAGDAVWLTFRRYHVFDPASGARIRTVSGVAAA